MTMESNQGRNSFFIEVLAKHKKLYESSGLDKRAIGLAKVRSKRPKLPSLRAKLFSNFESLNSGVYLAIKAIQQHPGPLLSAADCIRLDGIGPKTADLLHDELQKHLLGHSSPSSPPASNTSTAPAFTPTRVALSPKQLVESFLLPLGQNYVDKYLQPFVDCGFDSPVALSNLTEEDIGSMARECEITVPLGHRKSMLIQSKQFSPPTQIFGPVTLAPAPAVASTSAQQQQQAGPRHPKSTTCVFASFSEGGILPYITHDYIEKHLHADCVAKAQWHNENHDVQYIRLDKSTDPRRPTEKLLETRVGTRMKVLKVRCGCNSKHAGFCEHVGAVLYALLSELATGEIGIMPGTAPQAANRTRREEIDIVAKSMQQHQEDMKKILSEKQRSASAAKRKSSALSQPSESLSQEAPQPLHGGVDEALPSPPKKKSKKTESNDTPTTTTTAATKNNKSAEYIPRHGSGAWALMIALFEYSSDLRPGEREVGVEKDDLIRVAQQYTETSFRDSKDSSYTGWSSMGTLRDKGLVVVDRSGGRHRFKLTSFGKELGSRLKQAKDEADARGRGEEVNNTNDDLDGYGGRNGFEEYTDAPPVQRVAKPEPPEKQATSPQRPPRRSSSSNDNIVLVNLDDDDDDEDNEANIQVNPRQVLNKNNSSKQTSRPLKAPDAAPNVASSSRLPVSDPLDYDVKLLVDKREFRDQRDRAFLAVLQTHDLPFDWKSLPLGDFIWIAKRLPGIVDDGTEEEVVLDCVIERKTVDDLWSSLDDKRFNEQNYRLKKSGLNVIYLIEGAVDGARKPRFTEVITAIQFEYGFTVRRTESTVDSVFLLKSVTRQLQTAVEGAKSSSPVFSKYSLANYLNLFVKNHRSPAELLAEQLMQIPGVTPPKASAIVAKYPMLRSLLDAFSQAETPETAISKVTFGEQGRRIGDKVSQSIYKFYWSLHSDDALG